MKRLISIVYYLILIFIFNSILSAQSPVTVDGVKDAFWETATGHVHLGLENIVWGEVYDEKDCSGDFYLAWDEDYLYGFAEIKDDLIGSKNADEWWQNDAIAIKLDLVPSTTIPTSFNSYHEPNLYDILNVGFTAEAIGIYEGDGTDNSIIARAVSDSGYIIEFAIPEVEIINTNTQPSENITMLEGTQIGFCMVITDQDTTDENDGQLARGTNYTTINYWKDVTQFGSMTLLADNQVQLSNNNLVMSDNEPYLQASYVYFFNGYNAHQINFYAYANDPQGLSNIDSVWVETPYGENYRLLDDDTYEWEPANDGKYIALHDFEQGNSLGIFRFFIADLDGNTFEITDTLNNNIKSPEILLPAKDTIISEPDFLIKWSKVQNATSYSIKLTSLDGSYWHWEISVDSAINNIEYNQDETAEILTDGTVYTLQVWANDSRNYAVSSRKIAYRTDNRFILYVDSSNLSGVENGTPENPFNTIQEGINASISGDTVLVYPGRYKENIDFIGNDIVLTSFQMKTGDTSYISGTIIDGGNKGRTVTFTNGEDSTTVLNGFLIVNGGHPDFWEGGIGMWSSGPKLTNLIIRDNFSVNGGGGIHCNPCNPIIRNCKIYNNSSNGDGGGIVLQGVSNAVLENVLVYKNNANNNGSGGGIACHNESKIKLTNVTIANNFASDSIEIAVHDGSLAVLKNCIIWNNGQQAVYGNLKATYSDIKGGHTGTGNIDNDPLFVCEEEGDYRLNDGSACINSGTPDTSGLNLSSTDMEGNLRIYYDTIDMGAYESTIPYAPDKIFCYKGQAADVAVASGNDIRWYSDEHLDNLVFSGDTLAFELSPPITDMYYTFYSTQTINGKESLPNKVLLTVKPSPALPWILLKGENILICLDSGMYSYNWYHENVILKGETKQFCEIDRSWGGYFYVETGLENGCKSRSVSFSMPILSTGFDQNEISIEVYPVPNAGCFTLKIAGSQSGGVYISVRDFAGKAIESYTAYKNTEPLSKEFYLPDTEKGLYFIEVRINKKIYYRKILID